MHDLAVSIFAVVAGFTAAGLTASAYAVANDEAARFRASFATPRQCLWSLLVCTFAGPWILASGALAWWLQGRINAVSGAMAATICVVWSFCSGVLLVQMLALAGLVGPA